MVLKKKIVNIETLIKGKDSHHELIKIEDATRMLMKTYEAAMGLTLS